MELLISTLKIHGSVHDEKLSFKLLGCVSLLIWIGVLIFFNCLQKNWTRDSFYEVWPLGSSSNVTSLNLFCWYCFSRCFSELAQLIPQPDFQRRSACYSKRLYDFSVDIPRCYKDGYVNSLFPHIARLCNSLPVEFFPLISDRNGSKSRVNRYLYLWFFLINLFPCLSSFSV